MASAIIIRIASSGSSVLAPWYRSGASATNPAAGEPVDQVLDVRHQAPPLLDDDDTGTASGLRDGEEPTARPAVARECPRSSHAMAWSLRHDSGDRPRGRYQCASVSGEPDQRVRGSGGPVTRRSAEQMPGAMPSRMSCSLTRTSARPVYADDRRQHQDPAAITSTRPGCMTGIRRSLLAIGSTAAPRRRGGRQRR